jgi:hypothetical protein
LALAIVPKISAKVHFQKKAIMSPIFPKKGLPACDYICIQMGFPEKVKVAFSSTDSGICLLSE